MARASGPGDESTAVARGLTPLHPRPEAAFRHDDPLPLQPVPALVDGDPGEPRPEGALVPELAESRPCLDEGVLCGAVGVVRIAEEPVGEAGDRSLVALDQSPERLPVP